MQTRPIQIPRKPEAMAQRAPVSEVAPAPRLVRFAHTAIVDQFPDEQLMRIDVNGCLAGAVRAFPDAPRELGVGWAFMHGFFEASDALRHVTVDDGRISIMVDGGTDIDQRRFEVVGWRDAAAPRESVPVERDDALLFPERELVQLIEKAYWEFQGDGGPAGYNHAAMASAGAVHCVARDVHTDIAVAKVLGWSLLEGRELDARMLVVRGIVGQQIVDAAARGGVVVIISDAIPTANAIRTAARASVSIVGMATSRKAGLFVDCGHVCENSTGETSISHGA